MRLFSNRSQLSLTLFCALILGGCNSAPENETDQVSPPKQDSTSKKVSLSKGVDLSMFAKDAFTQQTEIV